MNKLKGEITRIKTSDGLKLQGILFEPMEGAKDIIIHIHGWTGNFYENVFIEHIANACIESNCAFLSFNTRGAGFVQEFLKKKENSVEYVKIGGSLEKFEECIIDIEAAISFVKDRGYEDIILEGHSTGCQKSIYYKYKTEDDCVKGLILLEPADDPAFVKGFLGERYDEAMNLANELIDGGKQFDVMPAWISFGVNLSAQKFVSISDAESNEGRLLHLAGELNELKSLDCPVLVVSAQNSEY